MITPSGSDGASNDTKKLAMEAKALEAKAREARARARARALEAKAVATARAMDDTTNAKKNGE